MERNQNIVMEVNDNNVIGVNQDSDVDYSEYRHLIKLIFSFWSFEELTELDSAYRRNYNKNKVSTHPIWSEINDQMKNTKNLTLNLTEDSPIEPHQIYQVISDYIKPINITNIHLDFSFNFENRCCHLANFVYDFTECTNLRNLSISNALLEFIHVFPDNLKALKLHTLYTIGNTDSYTTAFNTLLGAARNLEALTIDEFPENFVTASKVLRYLAVGNTYVHTHSIAAMFHAHKDSLATIRLKLYGRQLTSLLRYLNFQSIVLDKVETLILHFDDIESLKDNNYNQLPLDKVIFPKLRQLTFGITSPQQLLKCVNFCIYKDIQNITLRPDPRFSASIPTIWCEDFKDQLRQLNAEYMGKHEFSFINQSVYEMHSIIH